uniref:Myb/SANT-like DNA-binding domain-containing protein n=1 Tax=Trichobilharzia regenti TaxID=157069 RepID=A0AA85J6W8_TRIRE|nr:unnamed protein product [Trichobilharzia regenti]
MSQFQPISLGQTVQIPSQQQQQQQQQILQQQNQCQQYQLEPCDIKPQFSLIPNISPNLTNNNNNNSGNNMNISQSGIVSGMNNNSNNNNNNNTGGGQAGQFATPMNHTDVASLLMNPSKRAETFVIDEVKVMLKEIEARKHILLSLSPSTNRLKRRAWEDVAMSMAVRWPHSPRRTADQVKKKWENLVSKTKRKVRAGHITPELDWNETNAAVMQFLTQHSPPVRLRYLSSTGPSLLSLGDLQASSASVSASASSVLTTSGGATAMNGAFNQTNSHIYGLSNTSFSDPYSNNNNDSSIFSNSHHSSMMLSSEKSAILNSCLRQENKNNNNNNSSNNNTTNANAGSSNNSTTNGQHSFISHETNDLNSFNNVGSSGAGGSGDKQHLNTSTEDKDVDMTTGNNNNNSNTNNINNSSQNHGDSSEVVGNIAGSVHESFLSSFSPFNQSFLNFGLPPSNHHDSLYTTFNHDIQKELYSQLKQEHELRMDILRLQKQTWVLQMNLFKKMKVEQISSLFSSPHLSLPTTTATAVTFTPPSNATTNSVVSSNNNNSTACSITPVAGSNTSVSATLSSSLTVPSSSSNEVNHSLMNTSTNPSTTSAVTASLTTTPTATPTTNATTAAASITKPNSSIQQLTVNHQSESNSTPETRPLSPMFPGVANSHPPPPPPPHHHHQNVVLTNVEKMEG